MYIGTEHFNLSYIIIRYAEKIALVHLRVQPLNGVSYKYIKNQRDEGLSKFYLDTAVLRALQHCQNLFYTCSESIPDKLLVV